MISKPNKPFKEVGNKTIFDGVETKLSQLKEEGYVDQAIQNYAALWQPLSQLVEADKNKLSVGINRKTTQKGVGVN